MSSVCSGHGGRRVWSGPACQAPSAAAGLLQGRRGLLAFPLCRALDNSGQI